jgi:hypothetical protein
MLDGIMGTIDQQVDDKKDLLRANPNMQGTVGKDLIGVMALQKMQKEKQAAENELMLAQQNNPSTIKEQLEREVAGLTQNEMALQTAGIMNQRQQQQQQRQQRPQQQQRPQGIQQAPRPPMGAAPRPPMGGAPRPPMPQGAGLAGAPRPPMMAQGGIVGFNDGGTTDSKRSFKQSPEMEKRQAEHRRKQEFRRQIQKLFADGQIGPQRKQELLQQVDAGTYKPATQEQKAAGLNLLGGTPPSNKPLLGLGGNPFPKQIEQPLVTKTNELSDEELNKQIDTDYARQYVRDQYNKDAAADGDADADAAAKVGGGPQAGTGTDLASMLEGKLNTGVTAEQKATIGQNQASDRLDSGIKTTLDSMSKGDDPLAAMKAAQAQGDTRYNQDYNADDLKVRRQATDDELRRQLTPEALKEQRLRAGAVQRGGLAGARARADNRADERRYKLYNDSANNYANDMKAQVEKLKAVDSTAARIMEQISADRRLAVDVFGRLSIADQQAVTADKDRFQKQNQAAMEGLLAGMKIESEERLMQSIQNAKDSAELTGYWEKITAEKSKAMQEYLESAEYMSLDDEEKASAKNMRKLSIDTRFEKTEMFIIKRLEQLGGGVDLSVFYPKSDSSDEFKPQSDQEADDLQIR